MPVYPANIWSDLQAIRRLSPLIHNITNYVVMEQTANALLAIGASPVMTQAQEETIDMAQQAHAVILNMGTLDPQWQKCAYLAAQTVSKKPIPLVFDPVGAGATPYRTATAQSILSQFRCTAVRGNASEILTLSGINGSTHGVDSKIASTQCMHHANELASTLQSIVVISGAVDIITNGTNRITICNGHPLMAKITGMGCTATALIAAFLTVNNNSLFACAHAMAVMGIAGEIASEHGTGPGSFKIAFIDALHSISLTQITERLSCEAIL